MDYYKILEITEKAKYEEIRKAYHKMALRYHPDKCQEEKAEEKFKNVVEAYEVLTDPIKRRRYDLSRKLNDSYDFTLPNDILKFSRYFFSEKNIQKFKSMGNTISQQAENFGISINFEIMLHSFLNNIRNGKYHSLIEEYQLFKKFYETDNFNFRKEETKYAEQNKKKQEEEFQTRKEKKNQIKTLTESKIQKLNNRCCNVNINVNLENVYQRNIKVAPIEIDTCCHKCQGEGVVLLDNQSRKYKNSKSRYKKRNLSRKKNDTSFLDKKMCSLCVGTGKIKEEKRYLIDTSMDKICYLGQCFVNVNEPNYDLMFNIMIKPHHTYQIESKNRYNIMLNKEITFEEYYYGGFLKIPFLDNTMLDIKWQGFNNGKFQNTIVIPRKGLLVIPENNYMVSDANSIINNYKLDGASRGDLKVNLYLKIPILTEIQLEEQRDKIRDLRELENKKSC